MTLGDIILGIVASVGAILGGWATLSKAHTESKSHVSSTIDKHMERQDNRINQLETRADAASTREMIRDDYILLLRQHIADGRPPPPPPWPSELLHRNKSEDHARTQG